MNIKKLLDEEAKNILPDEEANNRIKSNLNINTAEEPEVRKQKKAYSLNWKKLGVSLAAICLCIAICISVIHFAFVPNAVEVSNSYITIDINPSFVIETDKDNNVISVKARNKDAAIVLFGLHFDNMSVDEVCNEILISSKKLGYLHDGKDVTLITANDNAEAEDNLNVLISQSINDFIITNNLNSSLIDGRSLVDKKEAKNKKTTLGKVALANKASEYKISDAFDLSLAELNNKINGLSEEEVLNIEKELEAEYEILENGIEKELEQLENTLELTNDYIDSIDDILDNLDDLMDESLENAIAYYNKEIEKLASPSEKVVVNKYIGENDYDSFQEYYKSEYLRVKNVLKGFENDYEKLEEEYEGKLDQIKQQIKDENEEEDDDDEEDD